MSKFNANLNTLYVGSSNPGTTKVTNKKMTGIDGPNNMTDNVTTDDSTGEEISTIYAGNMHELKVEQLVDESDSSYQFLDARAKDGASFFSRWRPDGDGVGKPQADFSSIITKRAPKRESTKKARDEFTITATNGTTWSTQ